MPFKLKNVEAIYKKEWSPYFHDMMHQEAEVHVHDMQNQRKKKIICKF
jgi:hypothetical protein